MLVALSCATADRQLQIQRFTPQDKASSDGFARELVALDARVDPEGSAELGVPGSDEEVVRWDQDASAAIAAYRALERRFLALARQERRPPVKMDLAVLAGAARRKWTRMEVEQRDTVPFRDPVHVIYDGLRPLLEAGKNAAALARLSKYTGAHAERPPLTVQAEQSTRRQMARNPVPLMPVKSAVERSQSQTAGLLQELSALFAKAGLSTAVPLLQQLEQQSAQYNAFVTLQVLPAARTDFHQSKDIYTRMLEDRGMEGDPLAFAAKARAEFARSQKDLQAVAAQVAVHRNLPDADYRAVIAALKREQLGPEALEAVYRKRIFELDEIIKRANLVSLPPRPLAFRMAGEAEGAVLPAPFYRPPPLIDNHGEFGTFVLPAHAGDDFGTQAASWWLTAHEGRPGHDLQFSTMAVSALPLARSIYAFNSVNAEGWATYAEWLIEPYVDSEARLFILQARLMRAAHAFLDIELNLGLIPPEEVARVMVQEVGFSTAWAQTCLLRYTTLLPGQAPSYLYGYLQMRALRAAAEAKLGKNFDARAFHDAVLAQGLLPPPLLRQAMGL